MQHSSSIGLHDTKVVRHVPQDTGLVLSRGQQSVKNPHANMMEKLGDGHRVHLGREPSNPSRFGRKFVAGEGYGTPAKVTTIGQLRSAGLIVIQKPGTPSLTNRARMWTLAARMRAKDCGTCEAMVWIWRSSCRMVGSLCELVSWTDFAAAARRSKVSDEIAV